jgi:MFS family permease
MLRCTYPITRTSIFAYIYPRLATFEEVEERQIPFCAGLMIAVITFSEFLSCMMWARLADSIGRRWSLLPGCVGCILTALTFGFATSLWVALLSRAIGGLSSPNVGLGVTNTRVGEIVTKRENWVKALSVIPSFRSLGKLRTWFEYPQLIWIRKQTGPCSWRLPCRT